MVEVGITADAGEQAAGKNLAVRLDGNGTHGTVGRRVGEGQIHGAIHIQAGDVADIVCVYLGKVAADEDPAIALHRQRIDRAVGTQTADIKIDIRRAVIIQPAHPIGRLAVQQGEAAAHQNFPDAIDKSFGHSIDRAVRAGTGVELAVQRTIRIQARDAVHRHAVQVGKITADQNATVRADGDRAHRGIRPHGGRRQGE